MDDNSRGSAQGVSELLNGAVKGDSGGGITAFMTAFESLPHCSDDASVKEQSQQVLRGFYQHPIMADSIMKSTLTGYLYRHGSEDVHSALSSRWMRLTINPIFIPPHENPFGLSIDVIFTMENTNEEDSTEEAINLAERMVMKRNLQSVILQIVVNNHVIKFKEDGVK